MVCQSCCKEDTRKKYKRGLWSPEEDRILKSYVLKYGHGYWSHVPKLAGLQRCGKSCRLRWINYLRPGLKRGGFSHEEQIIIINAQEIIGNKWSLIASMLPGRTDNEVKNFWNTHLKKKLNILGRDESAHKTLEEHTRKEIVECSSTNTCTEANELPRDNHIYASNEELNLQSSTYGSPEEITMPLAAESGHQYVKANPRESKSLLADNSFLGGLFHEWFYSGQNEKPAINMTSNRLELLPQLGTDSENSICMNYQSNQYPLPKETRQVFTSSELLSPQDQILNLSSDVSNNNMLWGSSSESSLPCEESDILCNDLSTTSTSSFNDWDNMSYNEVDLGFHGDYSFVENLDFS
ncbi:hypothetical protein SUGI_0979450 [Cryptomeria japonica]|uniref:myb-related protein 330-like n=1 Tax=Cryptomeria japonica TaxID=3369 RepID=UPI0024146EC6|nr:myb-related protein 330-like [Cryptomeria japonica]GLJ46475.1 hypothetical protein SUGI_0979450 [Cryptomeria japonica]